MATILKNKSMKQQRRERWTVLLQGITVYQKNGSQKVSGSYFCIAFPSMALNVSNRPLTKTDIFPKLTFAVVYQAINRTA